MIYINHFLFNNYTEIYIYITQASIDKLESLCNWYTQDVLKNCYNIQANKYELAFLYFCGHSCKRHNCYKIKPYVYMYIFLNCVAIMIQIKVIPCLVLSRQSP